MDTRHFVSPRALISIFSMLIIVVDCAPGKGLRLDFRFFRVRVSFRPKVMVTVKVSFRVGVGIRSKVRFRFINQVILSNKLLVTAATFDIGTVRI